MRCKKCGKEIPYGTLCGDCYNEVNNSNQYKKNGAVLMKLTRKFLPKYYILSNWELLSFCVFVFLMSIVSRSVSTAVAGLILIVLLYTTFMFCRKKINSGTRTIFYDNKVVYKFDFLFIHRTKELKYSQIKDITYNAKKLQKKFNLGNFVIISKETGIIFKGIYMEDVANAEERFKELTNLIGRKIG